MKYIIFLILYINSIYCLSKLDIKCPYEICRGYNIGSKCYEFLIDRYISCVTYLNFNNKNVLSCNNYFNYHYFDYNKIYISNSSINSQIEWCIIGNNTNSNDKSMIISDIKSFLNAKCIYENNNLIMKKKDIKCKIEKP